MSEKILVLDHDRDIRKGLEILLNQEGYQVRCVSGGDEAIRTLESVSFDLVIMDIRIPGEDGFQVMNQIKAFDENMKIIILTGAGTIENAVKTLRHSGAFDFLTKPLENGSQLISTVREALKKHSLNKEKKGLNPSANCQPPGNKILIVDDDSLIQELLTEILSKRNYETEVASEGFGAGTKVTDFKPDLIILDLIMPGMDGFEVCRRIKQNFKTAHIKILAITGYDTKENRDRIKEVGADGYMPKPVVMDRFILNVEDLLNNREVGNQ